MARQASLLSVDEARSRILALVQRLSAERVELSAALGRTIAEAITAGLDLPPFANSSMDGFAVSSTATDTASPARTVSFSVVAHIAAGSSGQALVANGQCARIMTGAPLPPGTDAVIPFEDVEDSGDHIRVRVPVARGACVRPAGNDIRRRQTVLDAGTEIRPFEIGLLAALGVAQVEVVRRPVVGILSTGDELVVPGDPLLPGQIYNSNSPMLVAAVTEAGAKAVVAGTVGDDPEIIAASLRHITHDADLLITTGGASVGDFDHMKDVIGAAGQVEFWRVRIRPGKPLLFGHLSGRPILGLPGNPTSAMVTFEEFVRPAIRTMLGLPPLRPEIDAVVEESIDNRGGRRTYARVQLRYEEGQFFARPAGPQDSAMLLPLSRADGLLIIPEDIACLSPGDKARVQVWRLPSTCPREGFPQASHD